MLSYRARTAPNSVPATPSLRWARAPPVERPSVLVSFECHFYCRLTAVVHEAATSHPREALYIMSNFTGRFATNLERWNFSKVAEVAPDAAIEYLPNLRAYMGYRGHSTLAKSILLIDTPRAMQLGYELNSEDQENFYREMTNEIRRVDVEVAVEMIDHFPSQDMTSSAAFLAIWEYGENKGEITEEQFRHFYKRLSDRHREWVDDLEVSQQWRVK